MSEQQWYLRWEMDGLWATEKIDLYESDLGGTGFKGTWGECLDFVHKNLLETAYDVLVITVHCGEGTYELPLRCVQKTLQKIYPEKFV